MKMKMGMNRIIDKLYNTGIVPVAVIENVSDALPLVRALTAGGLDIIEVTFRTEAALEAIRIISENCPEMTVGAGTVLNPSQAEAAKSAGASFIVSPGLNERTVKHCKDIDIPIIPGCITPTEIETALELGLSYLKFFPAKQAGGLPFINALSAPYKDVRFMPTGGVTPDNLHEYIMHPAVFCCGASYLVAKELVANGRFDEITRLSTESAGIVRNIRGGAL
jgi:2-dehydro-3-deoxyphosphogluconate aldolase/(4S)-4-hydroxy-2-oxoglutarate aldolase